MYIQADGNKTYIKASFLCFPRDFFNLSFAFIYYDYVRFHTIIKTNERRI